MEAECGDLPNDCAHEAGKYLGLKVGPGLHLRNEKGFCRCKCGLPVRAKEVRDWARRVKTKGETKDETKVSSGKWLVYEERNRDGQGHVYVKINGSNYGNGNYNWGGADTRTFIPID